MGKEGTEIHFLLENLFWGGFFGGRYQLTDVLFFPLLIFPQDPEQRGMGRVYSVSFRVANDFSCPLDICPCDICTTQLLGLQKAGFILAGSSFHPCFTPTQQRHGACLCGPHNSLVFQNDIFSFSCEQHHSSSTQGWLKSTGRTSHPRKAVEAMGAVQRLGRSWEQGGTSVDEASGCALGIPFIRDIALLQL